MAWSFQLYSARNFEPWGDVLATLASLGYAEVEGFGGVYGDPAGFRSALDRAGLAMPSGHFGIQALEGDLDGARRTADALGIRLVVCPWLEEADRPRDAAGWRRLGDRLDRIGGALKTSGHDFAWHNHDFEVEPLPDGSVPIDVLLEAAPGIGWEFDVAWAVRAGADPLAFIDRHADRIRAVHVKDIAPAGENAAEDGWADVGHGVVAWPAIMQALRAKTNARHFVMEHDNPADLRRFAGRSIAAARGF